MYVFIGGALAEGFQERLKEFHNFERSFEASGTNSGNSPVIQKQKKTKTKIVFSRYQWNLQ